MKSQNEVNEKLLKNFIILGAMSLYAMQSPNIDVDDLIDTSFINNERNSITSHLKSIYTNEDAKNTTKEIYAEIIEQLKELYKQV